MAIDRPVEEVFDYLADPRNRPEWQSSLRSVELVDDGPPRVGFRWSETTVVGVRPSLTITECERPRVWVEHGTWRGVAATLRLDFAPAPRGCTVGVSGSVEGSGPWTVPASLAGLLAGRAIASDVRKAGRILASR